MQLASDAYPFSIHPTDIDMIVVVIIMSYMLRKQYLGILFPLCKLIMMLLILRGNAHLFKDILIGHVQIACFLPLLRNHLNRPFSHKETLAATYINAVG